MASSKEDFGHDLRLMAEVTTTGNKVGAGKDFWASLVHNERLFSKVVELVILGLVYEVEVDYNQSLREMIEAGEYSAQHPDITQENFPFDARGEIERQFFLVRFNQIMSTADVLESFARHNLRPATMQELLAFGTDRHTDFAHKPLSQPQFLTIIALGSSWKNTTVGWFPIFVPCFRWCSKDKVMLSLEPFKNSWTHQDRLLAVRK